jgi:hypothetical protein
MFGGGAPGAGGLFAGGAALKQDGKPAEQSSLFGGAP